MKIPRFAFEKFEGAEHGPLTTQMKSVGERRWRSAGPSPKRLMKATRSLEVPAEWAWSRCSRRLEKKACRLGRDELYAFFRDYLTRAQRLTDSGMSPTPWARASPSRTFIELTGIDRWFLDQMWQVIELEHGDQGVEPARWPPRPVKRECALIKARPSGLRGSRTIELARRLDRLEPSEEVRSSRLSAAGHSTRLQEGRYLRRRVRGGYALPLLDVRG